jgi:NAD(P)-dependent dehydrogenase (short-subunit alcohol dehydrogenase family)
MNEPLSGKRAIVTGGAGGMGRAHALRLARLGADIAILDIDLEVAKKWNEELNAPTVADEIRSLGVQCLAIELDLTDTAAVDAAIGQVAHEWQAIDILVNNAGGAITPYDRSSPTTTTDEETRRVLEVNFISTVNCCRAAAPHLRRPGASVINIATIGVDIDSPGGRLALYDAAKAAVVRYTRSLALELGPAGIRANCVSPGLIETARIRSLAASRPGLGGTNPAESIPLRRTGRPDDVSAAVEFLAGEQSGYITGENIRVGGGIHLASA